MPPSRPRPRFNRNTRAADYVSPAGPHGRNVHGEEVEEVGGSGIEGVHVVVEGDWEAAAALTGREVVAGLCGARRSDAVVEGYCDGGGEGEGAENWEDGRVEHATLFPGGRKESLTLEELCMGKWGPCAFYGSAQIMKKPPANRILTPLTVGV